MNLDLSSMSEFEMCDRIQELIPRLDDESMNTTETFTSKVKFEKAINSKYESEECFNCPVNGQICGKQMEIGGKSVLLIIMTQQFYLTTFR